MAVKKAREKLTHLTVNSKVKWEAAATQAEAKILSLRLRITELQRAIQVFRRNAVQGEPWVEKEAETAKEAVPA